MAGSVEKQLKIYEEVRRRNITEKNKLLEELELKETRDSLVQHCRGQVASKKRKTITLSTPRPKKAQESQQLLPRRRSDRISGKEPVQYALMAGDDLEKSSPRRRGEPMLVKKGGRSDPATFKYPRPPNMGNRDKFYGSIEGIPMGETFVSRLEACYAGVHCPTVAGISEGSALDGDGNKAAESIVLNGGYPEDRDDGYRLIYTGDGGRDLKGTKAHPKNLRQAPQTKDQELMGKNLALANNKQMNIPVRVLRGDKLDSPFAPNNGFRYDGLYDVSQVEMKPGALGHRVVSYVLERSKDQAPPPWDHPTASNDATQEEAEDNVIVLD